MASAPTERSSWRPPQRVRPLFIALALMGATAAAAPAQSVSVSLLDAYEEAQAALSASAERFLSDRVEALDSLRRAEARLPEVTGALAPSLQAGLEATFARAETAIVNRSETDFAVQRAVLGGGLGRALFEHALEQAQAGDVGRAQTLLGLLAVERALRPTTFDETSAGALQLAFERRLAQRSLEALQALPTGDRNRDYRLLAERYGDLLTVQGSPRLPTATTDALLRAINQVVADEPLGDALSDLRTHLNTFAETAAAEAALAASGDELDSGVAAPTGAGVATGAETGVDTGAVDAVTGGRSSAEGPTTESPTAENPTGVPPGAGEAGAVARGGPVASPTAEAFPAEALDAATLGTGVQERTTSPLLLALLGLLALLAGARAVQLAATRHHPLQNVAVALLLLPAVLEGLAALAPLSGQTFLEPLRALSPLRQPALQPLWVLLVAVAVLCLALSWRRAVPVTQAQPVPKARASGSTQPATQPETPPRPAPTLAPHPTPSLASTGIDWDEDF